MHPVLFAFGPFHLYGYGAMVVLGLILPFWFLHGRMAKVGLNPMLNAISTLFVFATIAFVVFSAYVRKLAR